MGKKDRDWQKKDTQKYTGSSKEETAKSWHYARDDSGRDDSNYGDDAIRSPEYKAATAVELGDMLQDSGITNIMAVPSPTEGNS